MEIKSKSLMRKALWMIWLIQLIKTSLYLTKDVGAQETPQIIGLQNCSFVHMPMLMARTYPCWQISNIQILTGNATINISNINTDQYFGYIDSWSNHLDQFMFAAHDSNNRKYLQMVDLAGNTSYNFSQVPGFNFAAYLNKRYSLLIDEVYPYQIFNGSVTAKNHTEIFHYPPTLLTPAQHLICDRYMNCMWVMKQGMIVNYPMLPSPKMLSILNDHITKIVFARLNNTNFLYTGTANGILYQWVEVGLQDYVPHRVIINSVGSSIRLLLLFMNETLVVQSENSIRQHIYLPTSLVADCYAGRGFNGENISFACQNAPGKTPLIKDYSRNSYVGHMFAFSATPGWFSNVSNPTGFHNVTCNLTVQSVQHTPGFYANHKSYDCYFNGSTVMQDNTLYPGMHVEGCLKYHLRYYPVCRECNTGYYLKLLPLTTPDNQFQLTACELNVSTTTNTPDNSSAILWNSTNLINQSILNTARQVIQIINSTISTTKAPFYYMKNFLQLTLLAFIIHSLLSTWVLASLYYFLPFGPTFLKMVLVAMWKTYNISALILFGVQQPELPILNHHKSMMNYGEVIISNDFLQFSFDPLVMLTVAFFNYWICFWVRKLLIWLVGSGKMKLNWLKIEMFESVSDIVIELLPVLFLPCTNYIFSPHYSDYLEKVNLILFSTMAGFCVIFPFFYFAKLVNNKNRSQKRTQHPPNKVRDSNNLHEKQIQQILSKQKSKSARIDRRVVNKIQFFLVSKCKQTDRLLNCLLHLTVPVTVTLTSILPFFIVNGFIILCTIVNSCLCKKNKLKTVIRRLYFLLYHICFILMYVYKDGEIYQMAAIFALVIIIANLIHQMLEFICKLIKFFTKLIKDYRKCNQIAHSTHEKPNKNQEILKKQNAENKQNLKISFMQFMKRKEAAENIKNEIETNKLGMDPTSFNAKQYQKSCKAQNTSNFFKEEVGLELAHNEVLPFASAISDVIQKRKQRRKSKLRKQRLDKRLNVLKIEKSKPAIIEEDYLISESSLKEIAKDNNEEEEKLPETHQK